MAPMAGLGPSVEEQSSKPCFLNSGLPVGSQEPRQKGRDSSACCTCKKDQPKSDDYAPARKDCIPLINNLAGTKRVSLKGVSMIRAISEVFS